MGGEGHIFDMINCMRNNQQLLKSRREKIRDLKKIYLSHYNVHTSRHETPANLENIKMEIRKEIRQKRIKSWIITGGIMAIVWECNLNSVCFLFHLNHNKYNFFFLDLQMLLKVVFGSVQGRRRMSRLYTLAHFRKLPFLCV